MTSQRPPVSASRLRAPASAAILVVAGTALVGCSPAGALPSAPPRPTPSATAMQDATAQRPSRTEAPAPAEPQASTTAPAPASDIQQVALALPLVDESVAIPEYRRDSFGDGWVDVDRNGCATRQDVLQRDLEGETLADLLAELRG